MQHLNIDTLIDYQRGELAPGDDAAVLAHLEACADCTRRLNAESVLVELLRADARATERELPLGMRSAIMARIASLAPTPWERIAGWLRPIVVVPAAVAVAAAAFVVVLPLTQHPAQQPAGVPVSYYLEEHAAHAQENPIADRSAAVMMTTSFARTASTKSTVGQAAPPLIEAASAMTLADDAAR